MVSKFIARDCELSTTGVDASNHMLDPWFVSRRVLAQIGTVFDSRHKSIWPSNSSCDENSYASAYSTDCLRTWPSNGQCYYCDMAHVEVCTAETNRPRQFAAQCISTLLVAEEARRFAEQAGDQGYRFLLSSANADTLDPAISWGTHLNVAIADTLWDDLFITHRHPACLGYVASVMAAAIPFFGTGYLLSLKDGTTIFSLSGRAHHLSCVHTLATTERFRRGLLNTRREPHGTGQDRLHLIGFDYCLISSALLSSFLQCALAAAEVGYFRLALEDPVRAMRTWSWRQDCSKARLSAVATLTDGRTLTLPEYLRQLVKTYLRMVEAGLITTEVAPEAEELLPIIIELTHYAEEGSLPRCAKHLDWAAKLLLLQEIDGSYSDPSVRLMDHDFANTDPSRGTFWRLWENGLVDPLIDLGQAKSCITEAPAESRAWARGQLIEWFSEDICDVNWGHVNVRLEPKRWGRQMRVDLPHLESLNRNQLQPLLCHAHSVADLERLLDSEVGEHGDVHHRDPMMKTTDQSNSVPQENNHQRDRP